MAPHLIRHPEPWLRFARRMSAAVAATMLLGCGTADDGPSFITNPAPARVDVAVSPGNLILFQGQRAVVTVTVYRQGYYPDPVELSLGSLPPGVSAELETSVCPLGTTRISLNISTDENAPEGSYAVTIAASGRGLPTKTALFLLTVQRDTLPPSVSMEFLTDDGFVWTVLGDAWEWDLFLTRHGGYKGEVELVFEGLPTGVTIQLGAPVEVDSRTTRIAVGFAALSDAPLSDSRVVVTGIGPGIPEASTSVRFVVFPPWH